MTPRIDMIGRRFGRYVVLALSNERGSRGQLKYVCRCDCGRIKHVLGESLRSGKSLSCGCLNKEITSKLMTTHGGCCSGQSVRGYDKLYHVWQGMKDRCYNPNNREYFNYGGRGIKVCEDWLDYGKFREFMIGIGYDYKAPRGTYTIERKDVNRNYEPDNCTLKSLSEQQSNKTSSRLLTYNGKTMSVTEWAQELGINADTIFMRLHRGKSIEEALMTPVRKVHQYTVGNRTFTCKEWAKVLDIPWSTLRDKLRKNGDDMERIVSEYRHKR